MYWFKKCDGVIGLCGFNDAPLPSYLHTTSSTRRYCLAGWAIIHCAGVIHIFTRPFVPCREPHQTPSLTHTGRFTTVTHTAEKYAPDTVAESIKCRFPVWKVMSSIIRRDKPSNLQNWYMLLPGLVFRITRIEKALVHTVPGCLVVPGGLVFPRGSIRKAPWVRTITSLCPSWYDFSCC